MLDSSENCVLVRDLVEEQCITHVADERIFLRCDLEGTPTHKLKSANGSKCENASEEASSGCDIIAFVYWPENFLKYSWLDSEMSRDLKSDRSVATDSDAHDVTISTSRRDCTRFTLDYVFGPQSTQDEVHDKISPCIDDIIKGYNTTIFTYGQTSSGKTHSLLGGSGERRGLTPRLLENLFSRSSSCSDRSIDIYFSCLEIYQERLYDMICEDIHPKRSGTELRIRQHLNGDIWVEGMTEVAIPSMKDFNDRLQQALKRRTIASHAMNIESSRSHLCCIVTVKQRLQKDDVRVTSKLHLIDLAGSEMVRKTDASGARLNEAKHINKSLSALGNVIMALTSSPPVPFIPFRDSKLTRLLQDSLAGNAKTILLLTISGNKEHVPESLSTLKFGERARQLKTCPVVNQEISIEKLKMELLTAKKEIVMLNATIEELQKENGRATPAPLVPEVVMSSPPKPVIPPATPPNRVTSDDATRCAVCGLNEAESNELYQTTGEALGDFFTCDGNCGSSFHVACAGDLDCDGNKVVPTDEWFCATCNTVSDDATGSDDDLKYTRLQSAYHSMRRERNRLLNQWQHEKRIHEMMEAKRKLVEMEYDKEFISLRERIAQMEDENEKLKHENERMQKLYADLTAAIDNKLSQDRDRRHSIDVVQVATDSSSPIDKAKQAMDVYYGDKHHRHTVAEGIPKPWTSNRAQKYRNDERIRSILASPIRGVQVSESVDLSDAGKSPRTSRPSTTSASLDSMHNQFSNQLSSISLSCTDNPMSNRLQNLLKAVQEEAGSYAEMRRRHKDREVERNNLKSRHSRGNRTITLPALI